MFGARNVQDLLWLLYIGIGVLVVGGALLRCLLNELFASQAVIRRNSMIISAIGLLIALGVVGVGGVHMDGVAQEAIGGSFMGVLVAGGVCTAVYCLIEIWIVHSHNDFTCTLALLMLIGTLLLLIQVAAVSLLAFWASSVGKLPEQVAAADGGGRWEDNFFDQALGEFEHFACETYRTCCRDPQLSVPASSNSLAAISASSTCMSMPEQATNPAASAQLTVQDPSQPGFCIALSGGAKFAHGGVSQSTCAFLDSQMSAFEQPKCQASFCEAGLRGYHDFLTSLVEAAGRWLIPGTVLVAVLSLVQLLQIFYFRAMRNHAIKNHPNGPRGCCCCYEDDGSDVNKQQKQQKQQKKKPIAPPQPVLQQTAPSIPAVTHRAPPPLMPSAPPAVFSGGEITCAACTFLNQAGSQTCQMCGTSLTSNSVAPPQNMMECRQSQLCRLRWHNRLLVLTALQCKLRK